MRFKKIASVLASAVMVTSTLGFAATAATYPDPFIGESGSPDVAIVYGSGVGQQQDMLAVVDIQTDLNAAAVERGFTEEANLGEGESFQIAKPGTNEFNLGNNATDIYTTLDESELPNILALGTYTNDLGKDFDYDQSVALGHWNSLKHFQDDEFRDEEPSIGFVFGNGDSFMNYTLDFSPDAAEGGTGFTDLETTDIEMMGRVYNILDAGVTSGKVYLTLLDSSNSVVLNEGDVENVVIGDETFEISAQIFSSTQVVFTVNGEPMDDLNAGETREIPGYDDTYIGVKSILFTERESGTSQVQFSIGSGKIELIHGDEVQINDDKISDLYPEHKINAYITNSSTNIDEITLEWKADDDVWISDGVEVEMPGFEALKILMTEFYTDKEDMVEVLSNNDYASVKLEVSDGTVDVPILHTNGTDFDLIGKDSDELLVTNQLGSSDGSDRPIDWDGNTDKYFVATWISGDDHESFVLEITDIDDTDPAENSTKIESAAAGSSEAITIDIGDSDTIGNEIKIELMAANEVSETATLNITPAGGSGAIYVDRLVTVEGMKVQLPFQNTTSTIPDGGIDILKGIDSQWKMNFTEEDKDGNLNEGKSMNAVIGISTNGKITVSSVSEEVFSAAQDFEIGDTDDYVGYVLSDLATMSLYQTSGDEDELDLTYHGTEAYGMVYLAEGELAVGEGDGGAVGSSALILDSEISEASGKNIIVVGGSCVNDVAADLLGRSSRFCGEEWTAETGLGSDSFLIQTFSRSGSKVATLVAGWSQVDTQNAATALTTLEDVTTDPDTKYTGETADSIDLVVS